MSHFQQTLILIKPDAVERGLVGKVLTRFEDRGLKILGLKMLLVDPKLASDHYGDFVERYTPKLGLEKATSIKKEMMDFLSSGPIVAAVLEGVEAVSVVRQTVGSTYPNEAQPGTIRADLAHVSQAYANESNITIKNLVHASGNVEEAAVEVALWFKREELLDYQLVHERHTRY